MKRYSRVSLSPRSASVSSTGWRSALLKVSVALSNVAVCVVFNEDILSPLRGWELLLLAIPGLKPWATFIPSLRDEDELTTEDTSEVFAEGADTRSLPLAVPIDRKSTRLNSSHQLISYA